MHRPKQDLQNLKFSCLFLFPFSHKVVPQFVPQFGLFRAFKALRALKVPQIKFSHTLMHRPNQDLQNLKFSCLFLFPFSHKVVPQFVPQFGLFRAFKALRALKGPQIKFSHILMHTPYRDLLNLKFSCLYLFPFSHKVVRQKALGGGRWGSGGGSYTTLQLVNI